MTNGERRRARKAARSRGERLTGEIAIPRPDDAADQIQFSETPRGYRARSRWAESYDSLNGAPENEGDR